MSPPNTITDKTQIAAALAAAGFKHYAPLSGIHEYIFQIPPGFYQINGIGLSEITSYTDEVIFSQFDEAGDSVYEKTYVNINDLITNEPHFQKCLK